MISRLGRGRCQIGRTRLFSSGCPGEETAKRVKAMEAPHDQSMTDPLPHLIRLDGVAFRTLTAPLEKPFDGRFTRAMLATAHDLMERLRPQLTFVQSDEISLLFGGKPTLAQIMYSGRVEKMVSVTASMAAARFNLHFANELGGNWSNVAWFDARLLTPTNRAAAELEVAEAVWWRHRWDGRRNVINAIGQQVFGHRRLQGVELEELIKMLVTERQVIWHEHYPKEAVYGSFLKWIDLPHLGHNPLTGQTVATTRRRIQARSFDWASCMPDPAERAALCLADTWLPHHPECANRQAQNTLYPNGGNKA